MDLEMTVPDEVPVMTLPNTALFPQALMPLHIFEPRYRRMLDDVLASNRLFAVAGVDMDRIKEEGQFEPPHRVASVGIVRACQKSDDGTSNLLLQGLCRVELQAILSEDPYRRSRIRVLSSHAGATPHENVSLRLEISRLLNVRSKLATSDSRHLAAFLKTVEDPETFVDIAAFSLCDNAELKQRLLETLDVHNRLVLFGRELRAEIEAIRLQRKLQGRLDDDQISTN
jgi:Lon protease-like protein